MINSQRCSVFCIKNIFLYHNMRQENSVSIHARTKVSSHCSIGNVVCNGHTQTLCFMFQNSIGGGRVLFSRAMNIFSQDVYKLKTWCTSFLVTSDLCHQSPTQLYFLRLPHGHRIITGLKLDTQLQSKNHLQQFRGHLGFVYQFSSCSQEAMGTKILYSNVFMCLFHLQLGKLHTCKNSVQSISKFS